LVLLGRKMKTIIKTTIISGLMWLLGYLPVYAQEQPKEPLNLENKVEQKVEETKEEKKDGPFVKAVGGYNALNTMYGYQPKTSETEGDNFLRLRLLTNVGVDIGNVEARYSGLNEINNADEGTYYGRHVFFGGLKDLDIKAATIIKTSNEEVLDAKVGIRDTHLTNSLSNLIGGGGSIDLGFDDEAVGIAPLYTIDFSKLGEFGNGFEADVFGDLEFPYKGEPTLYSEVTLRKSFASGPLKNVTPIARVEIPDLFKADYKDATYLFGIETNF